MVVKLFGIAKEITGKNTLLIDSNETIANVADVKLWLSKQYPRLLQLNSYAIAVDAKYADDAEEVYANSEIALLPPVSGG